jgi:hypothetical protein
MKDFFMSLGKLFFKSYVLKNHPFYFYVIIRNNYSGAIYYSINFEKIFFK